MGNLVVNRELLAVVRDDQNPHGTRSTAIGLLETTPQVALVNNLQSLLDLTSLGHGNQLAVVTDVNEPVLLEDGAQERVEHDGWGGVGHNTRLLVQLLSEKVNTEIPVLAGLGRGGDADHLAGTLLQDHQVANADVVAGDGEGALLVGVDGRDVAGAVSAARAVLLGLVLDGLVDRVVVEVVELVAAAVVSVVTAVVVAAVAGVAVVTVPFTHFAVFGREDGTGRLVRVFFLEDAGLFKNGWLVFVIDGVNPLDLDDFFRTVVGVVLADGVELEVADVRVRLVGVRAVRVVFREGSYDAVRAVGVVVVVTVVTVAPGRLGRTGRVVVVDVGLVLFFDVDLDVLRAVLVVVTVQMRQMVVMVVAVGSVVREFGFGDAFFSDDCVTVTFPLVLVGEVRGRLVMAAVFTRRRLELRFDLLGRGPR